MTDCPVYSVVIPGERGGVSPRIPSGCRYFLDSGKELLFFVFSFFRAVVI